MRRILPPLAGALLLAGPAHAETALERGKYLVEVLAGCEACHTPKGPLSRRRERHLAGGLRLEGSFGVAVSANITQDRETGIGAWSDAQIIAAIREGKGRNGRTLGPPMPYRLYRRIADRDVRAMVAYLRTVRPVKHRVPPSAYTIALPAAWGPRVTSVPDPPRQDLVKYGEYLAGPIATCVGCHTPTAADGTPDQTRLFAGGRLFKGRWGQSYSANLTPDEETGIGRRSDAQVIRSIQGVKPTGAVLQPPMPWPEYRGQIAARDLKAIVAYLRSLPPIRNKVPAPTRPSR
jgi:mono/diheme cytochrome c family protein